MVHGTGHGLVERGWELDSIGAAADRLAAGHGGVLVLEGPPGIGKTSLLAELRRLVAERVEARVLTATAAELERTFPFGVARQLLEPSVRAEQDELHGAAALGAAALGVAGDGLARPSSETDDGSFAALHALYWLTADLASSRPVLMAVDDAQWADRNSARFLSFLANRVAEHPILLALGVRRTGEDQERRGLARLAGRAGATVLELRPLTEDGIGDALAARLGRRADPEFARAVHEAVGGNPLLLDQLSVELRREGVEPDAASVRRLASINATGVARSVLFRLAALGDDAQAVARAVAVLGAGAPEARIAAVAEMPADRAIEALARLEAADALEPGTRAFVHAIVRDAVYRDLTPAGRGLLHGRAARALVAEGAAPEQAAAHLLETAAVGDPEAVAVLRAAAASALGRGAPEAASRLLQRAAEEPPSDEQRAAVLAELGHAELRAGESAARTHLREAADAAEGNARVSALTRLGHAALLSGDLDGAIDAFREAATSGGEEEARLRAEAELASALINSRRFDEAVRRLDPYRDRAGVTPGERMLLAVSAFVSAQQGDPVGKTVEIAHRALAGGQLLAEQTSSSLLVHEIAWALLFADALEDAEALLDAALADARRRGAVPGFALAGFGRAWLRLRRGDLAGARAEAESSYGTRELYHWHATAPLALGLLAEALVDQGELDQAQALLVEGGLDGDVPDVAVFNLALYARGRLGIARGDWAAGTEDVLTAGAREEAVGGHTPGGIPWRSTAATALATSAERDGARELADAELDLAERLGCPRAIGVALRAAALTREGDESVRLLSDSLDALRQTEARLERARTAVELGAALRRANRRGDARDHLRVALDDAIRCAARPLAERAHEELSATGARPRRKVLSGVDALTPTELRIARMAATGQSNPEIAQGLFVTRKNVEFHLSNAYRKLRIGSRRQLGDVLQNGGRPPL